MCQYVLWSSSCAFQTFKMGVFLKSVWSSILWKEIVFRYKFVKNQLSAFITAMDNVAPMSSCTPTSELPKKYISSLYLMSYEVLGFRKDIFIFWIKERSLGIFKLFCKKCDLLWKPTLCNNFFIKHDIVHWKRISFCCEMPARKVNTSGSAGRNLTEVRKGDSISLWWSD